MRNVIISGTSRGIGFELAQLFAKSGYKVLALSRNAEPLKNLNIKNITTLSIDLSKDSEVKKVTNFVTSNWKSVDVLINNAGKLINKPFEELTSADYLSVFQINVFSVAELTRQLIPYLKKGSHVVNISSIGGVQGSSKFPGLAAYSSSKGALITLTELLAEEYKERQISFNVLALGAVQTEMLEEAFPGYKAPVSAFEMAEYIYNFAINGHKFQNGKIVEVSSSTP
ncbi:MAG: SDR family oxidoreductase [Lutibacter sp.]|uniref:SDR family NAD(P)-dependent oxidoreductase n=1 Tax=Lutibacter sp. TaxID=1925666 RepID=UPI0017B89D5D|nr:SDR family oxidoreductase [Lutibacter sp.]MBT8316566.1 SDR family oxidoreductase [Lutibacter sp.]NNJ57426.1 SDR family oxidoreductase [Lutibacter sp.]